MADKHESPIALELEAVVTQLDALGTMLGIDAVPRLEAVRAGLIAALAARDRGDVVGAVDHIGHAMDHMTALADQLDPAEGTLMRALAQKFRAALQRGDLAQAKQGAAVMFEKSGAVERNKKR